MNYFKLRPLIKLYKKQVFDKYGIRIKKVKWTKAQLSYMGNMLEPLDIDANSFTVKCIDLTNNYK